MCEINFTKKTIRDHSYLDGLFVFLKKSESFKIRSCIHVHSLHQNNSSYSLTNSLFFSFNLKIRMIKKYNIKNIPK